MGHASTPLDSLYDILAGVDHTYARIPSDARLEIEKISQGLAEYGPRKLRRRGPGMEFFESRDFRPETDEPRRINARLSARAGRPIVTEREAEIRQHIYLWRDGTPSMDYRSDSRLHTKKMAAEIMLLSFAKHLARNEEMIGVLDGRGMFRGGRASESLARQLNSVFILTGDMPKMERKLPRNSTAVLFSDFFMPPETLREGLETITGQGLSGYLVMVADPQEMDFKFKGHIEFQGMEGEGRQKFKKAESMMAAYQQRLQEHIAGLKALCAEKGFGFILQRTDEPLENGLLAIYGLPPVSPQPGVQNKPAPKFGLGS